jgi:hypothetical protein
MTKYANANGISNKEAYQEYLNDLEQLKQETNNFNDTLNRSYDEIKSIQEHLSISEIEARLSLRFRRDSIGPVIQQLQRVKQ